MLVELPFSQADSQAAYDEWGANCGPNALAVAIGRHINDVRALLPGFEGKRYTNPSMMKHALELADHQFVDIKPAATHTMFTDVPCLVRIQWCGPWTAQGANPKWAYRQTHWIVTWIDDFVHYVFDVNGGARTYASWEAEIVSLLTGSIPRANGEWFPTHVWMVL